jgi:RNA polymerase sigma-70 factor (ECF subfamily)
LPEGATSSGLLCRLKASDQAAWGRLVRLYGRLVYRWCRQAGLQAADAEEVGQEVFQAVIRKIGDFEHHRGGGTFRGWLKTITRNKVCDYRRARPPERNGLAEIEALPALHGDPADSIRDGPEVDEAEVGLVLRRAVELVRGEFRERTWQAFWRVAVNGADPRAVAADLGMTANAVYLARFRVLRRLRRELADLAEARLLE